MTTNTESKEWLSLHQASERLGVSPATLRMWADRGRVQSFRTPGGHRRFRKSDLTALTLERDSGGSGQQLRVLAHVALGRTRFQVSDGWLRSESWYKRFPDGAREEHRTLGRRVVTALTEILSTADPDSLLLTRASELGQAYAESNHAYDISLPDALRAFMYFRDGFIESLVELARATPGLDVLPLMRRTSHFVDQMLLTMVEAQIKPDRRSK